MDKRKKGEKHKQFKLKIEHATRTPLPTGVNSGVLAPAPQNLRIYLSLGIFSNKELNQSNFS